MSLPIHKGRFFSGQNIDFVSRVFQEITFKSCDKNWKE